MNVRTPYDALWRKRLRALQKAWPEFLAGDAEALHKTRVASRRIREALPVVGADARSKKVKKLRRKVRALTQFLGPIRELDVELALIDEQAATKDLSPQTQALLRREVATRQKEVRQSLAKDK